MPLIQLILGLILSALIGFVAYQRGSLSKSGLMGAMLIGTTIFGFGGLAWGVLLVVFFVSSSALSHFKESRKAGLAEKFSKGQQRDLAQTLANGGAAALIALANFVWPNPIWWVAFVGALATVNADTWATELGVLSKSSPRLITTGKIVEVGTSGAITLTGTLAALGGAALIAIVAIICEITNLNESGLNIFVLVIITCMVGLMGSLFDSLLGSTIQAIYFCDSCDKETERHPTHTCGNTTRHLRGWRWLDNDWVNFISSVAGGLLAVGIIVGLGVSTLNKL